MFHQRTPETQAPGVLGRVKDQWMALPMVFLGPIPSHTQPDKIIGPYLPWGVYGLEEEQWAAQWTNKLGGKRFLATDALVCCYLQIEFSDYLVLLSSMHLKTYPTTCEERNFTFKIWMQVLWRGIKRELHNYREKTDHQKVEKPHNYPYSLTPPKRSLRL